MDSAYVVTPPNALVSATSRPARSNPDWLKVIWVASEPTRTVAVVRPAASKTATLVMLSRVLPVSLPMASPLFYGPVDFTT